MDNELGEDILRDKSRAGASPPGSTRVLAAVLARTFTGVYTATYVLTEGRLNNKLGFTDN